MEATLPAHIPSGTADDCMPAAWQASPRAGTARPPEARIRSRERRSYRSRLRIPATDQR